MSCIFLAQSERFSIQPLALLILRFPRFENKERAGDRAYIGPKVCDAYDDAECMMNGILAIQIHGNCVAHIFRLAGPFTVVSLTLRPITWLFPGNSQVPESYLSNSKNHFQSWKVVKS